MARCWAGDIGTVDVGRTVIDIPLPRTEGDAVADLPEHRAARMPEPVRTTSNATVGDGVDRAH